MPSHSSSSHSSSSHSSSHSTSHSSSSHSSSSHSSYSSSGGSRRTIGGSRYARPSFTKTVSEYTRDRNPIGRRIARERYNQPLGYDKVASGFATEHYAEKHNYTYYPYDWKYNDVTYKRGYYDEEGNHYDRVVFERDGVLRNLICNCEYCGSTTKMDWKTGETLKCPKCGGSVTIETPYDTYTEDPDYTAYEAERDRIRKSPTASGNVKYIDTKVENIKSYAVIGLLFIAVVGFFIFLYTSISNSGSSSSSGGGVSNVEIWGRTIYLKSQGNGSYSISDTSSDYDKKLTWDYGEDSYYDKNSRCFLWYNTDVAPNLWQYYYVGISTSYPDGCGWLEYEPNGWYIEVSSGNWQKYTGDTSNFWHIEIDPKDFE